MPATPLHLFDAYGVELEYMLVDRETLAVAPLCDRVLAAEAGTSVFELQRGAIGWSIEMAAHVLELATNGPTRRLDAEKAQDFTNDLRRVDELAAAFGARVLPTAMHPLMDPLRDTTLWPSDQQPLYAAFDRIFGCAANGWSNLQSCHLDLPFHGDQELHRLHAAIRPLLALLPGLAASSPIVGGQLTGVLDTRLRVYRDNQRKLGPLIGKFIPEAVTTAHDYEEEILQPIYRELAPLDPEGVLRHQRLNLRGAIARFDRGIIQIRLLDIQETPLADLAIVRLVAETVRALAEERWVPLHELDRLNTTLLAAMLDQTIVKAEHAVIESEPLLRALGYDGHQASLEELWTHLAESLLLDQLPPQGLRGALETILGRGTLASRIVEAVGPAPSVERIREVYGRIGDCALEGQMFVA
jgi:glutamate---cysteine ligase / carboxylate-amine ligase